LDKHRNASDVLSTGMSAGEMLKSGMVRTSAEPTAAAALPPIPASMISNASKTRRPDPVVT